MRIALLLCLLLAACGGGPDVPDPPQERRIEPPNIPPLQCDACNKG